MEFSTDIFQIVEKSWYTYKEQLIWSSSCPNICRTVLLLGVLEIEELHYKKILRNYFHFSLNKYIFSYGTIYSKAAKYRKTIEIFKNLQVKVDFPFKEKSLRIITHLRQLKKLIIHKESLSFRGLQFEHLIVHPAHVSWWLLYLRDFN